MNTGNTSNAGTERHGPALVGRRREHGLLRSALDAALGGAGQVVLIAGEPGIGKTRLALEVETLASERAVQVLWGRCWESPSAPPYWPWSQALRQLLGAAASSEVGPVAVILGTDALPASAPPLAEDDHARARTFHAAATLLSRCAEATPLLLILDDLHWADQASLALLRFAAPRFASSRMLVVGTYRDTEMAEHHPAARAITELLRERSVQRIVLRELTPTDLAQCWKHLTGADASDTLARALHAHTGGNPFYLTEVARALREDASLAAGTDLSRALDAVAPDVVANRLNRLSADCRAVLDAAAAIGPEFHLGLLARVFPEASGVSLLTVVDEATRARLVRPLAESVGGYSFVHALIRETIYRQLTPLARAQLHGRIGPALEAVHGAKTEIHLAELAYHFTESVVGGGDADKAVEYAQRAGDQDLARLAFESAAKHYRRALAALDFTVTDSKKTELRRCLLWLSLGEALNRCADIAAGKPAFAAAADVVRSIRAGEDGESTATAVLLARAAYGYGGDGNATGSVDLVRIQLLEEAIAAIGEADDGWRVRLLARLAIVGVWSNQLSRTHDLCDEAVAAAERSGDPGLLAEALDACHWTQWGRTPARERLRIATRLLDVARRQDDRVFLCWARFWRFVDFLEIGEIHQSESELASHRELALALRDPRQLYFSAFGHAALLMVDGRFADAERAINEAAALGEEAAVADTPVVFAAQILLLRWCQGRIAEAAPILRAAVAHAEGIPAARSALAFLDAQLGNHAAAAQQVEQLCTGRFAWLPDDVTRIAALTMLAEACADVGGEAQAALISRELEPFNGQNAIAGFGAACWGPIARVLGRLAAVCREDERMVLYFEQALDHCVRMRAAPWLAQIQYDYAAALVAVRGKHAGRQADLLLQDAQATAQRLGMARLAEKTAALRFEIEDAATVIVPPPGRARAFVGRQRESAALRAALDAARGGCGSIAFVGGEPGIGKTELAIELTEGATVGEPLQVLWGRCREGSGTPPFWPWIQMIRASLQAANGAELAAALGEASPVLAQIVPQIDESGRISTAWRNLDPAAGRLRLFEAVASWLRALCARAPAVLILDDLHWADGPSLELLEFLIAELPQQRGFVIGMYRDSEIGIGGNVARLTELARRVPSLSIALEGLKLPDITLLLEAKLGAVPSATIVSAVARRTAGNPFFINEMLQLVTPQELAASGAPEQLLISALLMSPGARELISRRLDALPSACRALLQIAAVVGNEFDVQLLQLLPALAQGDAQKPASVLSLLGELEAAILARLIVALPQRVGTFTFAHALIRETLYGSIPTAERISLHWQIGQTLARVSLSDEDAPIERIAEHLFEGQLATAERDDAVRFSLLAGERAVRRYAYLDAATHFERTLDILSASERERRFDVLCMLGNARMRAGDLARSRDAYAAAAELARHMGDGERFARAALGFVGMILETQQVDAERVRILEEALRRLDRRDSDLRARVLGALAMELYYSEAVEQRDAFAREAVAIARRVGDAPTLVDVLRCSHLASWGPDNLEERLRCSDEICQLAAASGTVDWILSGNSTRLMDRLEAGDVAAVDKSLAAYARIAEQTRQAHPQWRVMVFRTMRALLAGDFEAAEQLMFATFGRGQQVHPHYAMQFFGAQLFILRREQGRLAELVPAVEDLANQNAALPAWRGALAYVYAVAGRRDDAARELERLAVGDFTDIARDNSWLGTMGSAAIVANLLGNHTRARQLYALLRAHESQWIVLGDAAACGGPVAYYLGLLAESLDLLPEAAAHHAIALDSSKRCGARPAHVRTQLAYGSLLLREAALAPSIDRVELLEQTQVQAAEFCMKQVADEAAELLASARAALGGTTESASLHRHGDHWVAAYAGQSWSLKDSKGVRILACLLREPGREFHVLDLMQMSSLSRGSVNDGLAPRHLAMESGLPILDAAAKNAYRRRLEHLQDELDEAERFNDVGRAERAREEIASIREQLAAAVGLGGRNRVAASAAERARSTVTQRLKEVVRRVGAWSPAVGESLQASIRTGTFCSFVAECSPRIRWETD